MFPFNKITTHNLTYLVLLAYFLYDLITIYYKRSCEFNNLNRLGRFVWKVGFFHKFIFLSDIFICGVKICLTLTTIRIVLYLTQLFNAYCVSYAKLNGPILPSGILDKIYAQTLNSIFKFFNGSNLFYYADMMDTKHSRSYVMTSRNVLFNGVAKINGFCSTCYAYGHNAHEHNRTYLSDMSIFIAKQCRIFCFKELEQRYNPVLAAPTDTPQLFTFERVYDFYHHIETYFIPTQRSNQLSTKHQATVQNIIWPEPISSVVALTKVVNGIVGSEFYSSDKFGKVYINTDNRIPHYLLIKYNDNNLYQKLQRLCLLGVKDVTIYGSVINLTDLENFGFRSIGLAHGNLDIYPITNPDLYPLVLRNTRSIYGFSDIRSNYTTTTTGHEQDLTYASAQSEVSGESYNPNYDNNIAQPIISSDIDTTDDTDVINCDLSITDISLDSTTDDINDKSNETEDLDQIPFLDASNSVVSDGNIKASTPTLTRSDSSTSFSTVNTVTYDDLELIVVAENVNQLFYNKEIRLTIIELNNAYKEKFGTPLPNLSGYRGKFLFACGITKRSSNGSDFYKRNKFYNPEELTLQIRKFSKQLENYNSTKRLSKNSIFKNSLLIVFILFSFVISALGDLSTRKCEAFKYSAADPPCEKFINTYPYASKNYSVVFQLNMQTHLFIQNMAMGIAGDFDEINGHRRCLFRSYSVYDNYEDFYNASYLAELNGRLFSYQMLINPDSVYRDMLITTPVNFRNPAADNPAFNTLLSERRSNDTYLMELYDGNHRLSAYFSKDPDYAILYTHPSCINTCYCNKYSNDFQSNRVGLFTRSDNMLAGPEDDYNSVIARLKSSLTGSVTDNDVKDQSHKNQLEPIITEAVLIQHKTLESIDYKPVVQRSLITNVNFIETPVVKNHNELLETTKSLTALPNQVPLNYIAKLTRPTDCPGKYNKRTYICTIERENLPLSIYKSYDSLYTIDCLTYDETCNNHALRLVTDYGVRAVEEFKAKYPELYVIPEEDLALDNGLSFEDLYYLYLDEYNSILPGVDPSIVKEIQSKRLIYSLKGFDIYKIDLNTIPQHSINCEILNSLYKFSCSNRNQEHHYYSTTYTYFNIYRFIMVQHFNKILTSLDRKFNSILGYSSIVRDGYMRFETIYKNYRDNFIDLNPEFARSFVDMGLLNISVCSLYQHPDTDYIFELCNQRKLDSYTITYVTPIIRNIFYVSYLENTEQLNINSYYNLRDAIAYKILDTSGYVVYEKFLARKLFYKLNTYTTAYSHVDNRLQFSWGIRSDYNDFMAEDTVKITAYTGFEIIDVKIYNLFNFKNITILITVCIIFHLLTRSNDPRVDIVTCVLTLILCYLKTSYLFISYFGVDLNFIYEVYGIAVVIYTTIRAHDYYFSRGVRLLSRDNFTVILQFITVILAIFNMLMGTLTFTITLSILLIVIIMKQYFLIGFKNYWQMSYIKAPLAAKIWNHYRDSERYVSDEAYFSKISREFKYNLQNNNLSTRTRDIYLLQEIYRHIIVGNSKGFHPSAPNLVCANYNVATESTFNKETSQHLSVKAEALTSNRIPYNKPEHFQSNFTFELHYDGALDGCYRSLGAFVLNNHLYVLRHLLGNTNFDFENPDWNSLSSSGAGRLDDFNFANAKYDYKQFWLIPVKSVSFYKYTGSVELYNNRMRNSLMYNGYAAMWDYKMSSWVSGYVSRGTHDISTEAGMCGSPIFTNAGQLLGLHIASSSNTIEADNPWAVVMKNNTIVTNYFTDVLGNVPKAITNYDLSTSDFAGQNHPVVSPTGALLVLMALTCDSPNATNKYDDRLKTYFGIDKQTFDIYADSDNFKIDYDYFFENRHDILQRSYMNGQRTFLTLIQVEGLKEYSEYNFTKHVNSYSEYRNNNKNIKTKSIVVENAVLRYHDARHEDCGLFNIYCYSFMEILQLLLYYFNIEHPFLNFSLIMLSEVLGFFHCLTFLIHIYNIIRNNDSIILKALKLLFNVSIFALLFMDKFYVLLHMKIPPGQHLINVFTNWLYNVDISSVGSIRCYDSHWRLLTRKAVAGVMAHRKINFDCTLNFCTINPKDPVKQYEQLIYYVFGIPLFESLCVIDITHDYGHVSYLQYLLKDRITNTYMDYIHVFLNYYFTTHLILTFIIFVYKRFNKFKTSIIKLLATITKRKYILIPHSGNLKTEGIVETNRIATILNAITALVKFEQYQHLKPLQTRLLALLEGDKDIDEYNYITTLLKDEFLDLYNIILPLLEYGVSHEEISNVVKDGYLLSGDYDLDFLNTNISNLLTTLCSDRNNNKRSEINIETKIEFDIHYNNIKTNIPDITRERFDYEIEELINQIQDCEGNEITDAFLEISTLMDSVQTLPKSKDNSYFLGRLNYACAKLRKLNNIYLEELKRQELQAIRNNKKEQNRLAEERARELTQRNKVINITRAMLIILNTIRVANLTDNKQLILDRLDDSKRDMLIKLTKELNKEKYQQRNVNITTENATKLTDTHLSYYAPQRALMSVIEESKGLFLWNDAYSDETLSICGKIIKCELAHKHSISNCYKNHMRLYYDHLNSCSTCFKFYIQRKHPRCGSIYTVDELKENPGYLYINHLSRWRNCKACNTCSFCPRGTKQDSCDGISWHENIYNNNGNLLDLFVKSKDEKVEAETWVTSNTDKGELKINTDKVGIIKITDKTGKVEYATAVPKDLNLTISNMVTHDRLRHNDYNIYFKKNISDYALLGAYYNRIKGLIDEHKNKLIVEGFYKYIENENNITEPHSIFLL